MAFLQKKPPITVVIDKDRFNLMMETIIKDNNDYFKTKFLKYGITNDINQTVELGLYPREISQFILLLINNLTLINPKLNYYETIKKIQLKLREVDSSE